MKFQVKIKVTGYKTLEIDAETPADAKLKTVAEIEKGLDTSELKNTKSVPQNATDVENKVVYWF